jgi:hypothetical protein
MSGSRHVRTIASRSFGELNSSPLSCRLRATAEGRDESVADGTAVASASGSARQKQYPITKEYMPGSGRSPREVSSVH